MLEQREQQMLDVKLLLARLDASLGGAHGLLKFFSKSIEVHISDSFKNYSMLAQIQCNNLSLVI